MSFWLDIYAGGIKLGRTSQHPMTVREALYVRYINDSIMALKELCLAAAEGSTTSEEMLRDIADRLVRLAGDARQARNLVRET